MSEKSDKNDLLLEISDDELKSLECPTYESQEKEWKRILNSLNEEKLKLLIESIGLIFIQSRKLESHGTISKIFLLNVKDEDENIRELCLKIRNPHLFWKNKRTINEVSIMNYLKKNSNLPIPKILSYSFDASHSLIECEYILMEKVPGETLEDLYENNPQIELPDHFIDQMLDFVKSLRAVNINSTKIGCFSDENLSIASTYHDGPIVDVCDNYFEFIDFQLKWEIKEIRKYKKYQSLADNLGKFRSEFEKVVFSNDNLNYLNFNDKMVIRHGDLNASNILVDSKTFKLTGIIDWEFASHGFGDDDFECFLSWCENQENYTQRISEKISKLDWYKEPIGKKLRSKLFDLVSTANQLAFYNSTWYTGESSDLAVREYVDMYANELTKFLEKMPDLLQELKDF